jgi:hypothetical protein
LVQWSAKRSTSRASNSGAPWAQASFVAPSAAARPQAQQQAFDKLRSLLSAAWQKIIGTAPSTEDVNTILRFVTVIQFNLDGPDRVAAIETLAHVTENANVAPRAFAAIERTCENLMALLTASRPSWSCPTSPLCAGLSFR